MTRLRGWALRGQRLIDAVPHGHWKTTTLIAALDQDGMRCSMLLDGAVNALAFQAFVEILAPTLGRMTWSCWTICRVTSRSALQISSALPVPT